MMDRSVLSRQMFAQGGAAFPDLSGDGKVTLMGRGVPMQMGGEPQMALNDYLGGQTDELAAEAARLGISKEQLLDLLNQREMQQQPVGMAMGGDPAMAQGVGSMMPPPMEEMPQAPEGVDPQMLEQMLTEASANMGDLENVDDYEQMMNMMRGDAAPIEARREELAGLVGPEDAAQTPESVLALVQPVIQLASVDQGIGELAAEQMTQPVDGAMAEGIMSTVAPPPQPAAPGPMDPAPMGGPPPVNFNQGGVVRPVVRMQDGGDPVAQAGRLGELYAQKVPLYQSIMGDQSAALEDQKRMTQAQILFDVANTALAFSGPMEGERKGLSPAERLALATQKTQLLPTIGARAGELLKSKQAATGKEQQMKLSALGAAETGLAAESTAAAAERKAALEAGYRINEIMLKQTGDMELAESQANWKASLQDDQQLASEAIKRLEGDQSKEAIRLRENLQNQNAIRLQLLKGEQALEELDLAGMNAIAKQDKAHIQALTIQENNQTLSREQKRIDVGLKTIDQQIAMDGNELKEAAMLQQANAETRRFSLDEKRIELEQKGLQNTAQYRANQLAIAYADQDIKEAKMLQDADAATQQQVLAQKKLVLEERDMLVKEAAAGLDKFGKGLEGKLLGKLTDVEKLKLYESGDLGEQETTDLEASMLRYTDIGPVFDETLGKMVIKPARKLPDRVVRARAAREAAGFRVAPLGGIAAATGATVATDAAATPAATDAAASTTTALGTDVTQQDVGAFPTGDDLTKTTYSSLLDEIDVSDAFGFPTAFGNFLNRGVELVSLGTAQAAPDAAKSTAIIESINQNATLIYLEAVKGRADVELRKEIQSKLPEASAFTRGEKSAYNKAKSTVAFLNSKIDPIELELRSPKGEDVGKRRNALAALKSVRDTYAKLADKLEAVVDPKPKPPRSNQAVSNDLFGDSDG